MASQPAHSSPFVTPLGLNQHTLSTGISTCDTSSYPRKSGTRLRSDSPEADERCFGNLAHSAWRIRTSKRYSCRHSHFYSLQSPLQDNLHCKIERSPTTLRQRLRVASHFTIQTIRTSYRTIAIAKGGPSVVPIQSGRRGTAYQPSPLAKDLCLRRFA